MAAITAVALVLFWLAASVVVAAALKRLKKRERIGDDDGSTKLPRGGESCR